MWLTRWRLACARVQLNANTLNFLCKKMIVSVTNGKQGCRERERKVIQSSKNRGITKVARSRSQWQSLSPRLSLSMGGSHSDLQDPGERYDEQGRYCGHISSKYCTSPIIAQTSGPRERFHSGCVSRRITIRRQSSPAMPRRIYLSFSICQQPMNFQGVQSRCGQLQMLRIRARSADPPKSKRRIERSTEWK